MVDTVLFLSSLPQLLIQFCDETPVFPSGQLPGILVSTDNPKLTGVFASGILWNLRSEPSG